MYTLHEIPFNSGHRGMVDLICIVHAVCMVRVLHVIHVPVFGGGVYMRTLLWGLKSSPAIT